MTTFEVLKFFLKYSDLSFRPAHVAKMLNKPEKTIYRCLAILTREQILKESKGVYWVNEKASVKSGLKPNQNCPILLAIILILLPGSSYSASELRMLQPKFYSRHACRLEDLGMIGSSATYELTKNVHTEIWLNTELQQSLGRSQTSRVRMGALYGK